MAAVSVEGMCCSLCLCTALTLMKISSPQPLCSPFLSLLLCKSFRKTQWRGRFFPVPDLKYVETNAGKACSQMPEVQLLFLLCKNRSLVLGAV